MDELRQLRHNQWHPTSPDQTHICVGDQSTWRAYFTAAAIRAADDEPRIIGLTIAEQLQTRTNWAQIQNSLFVSETLYTNVVLYL